MNNRNLKKILCILKDGNCCRVLGPPYRSKSKLMREAAEALQKSQTHYAPYQSLAEVPLINEEDFFSDLYRKLKRQLQKSFPIEKSTFPKSTLEFQYALINIVRQSDRNVAIFIDDLELAPPNLVASLLGALRAVFTMLINQPGARLQAVVCGSLSLSQVALESASRFESISQLVLVGNLVETERFDLVVSLCQKANLQYTQQGMEALLEQTDGDPFLIEYFSKVCFAEMHKQGRVRLTPARIHESVDLFLSQPLDWRIIEILKQIESNPSLLTCTLKILDRGEVLGADLPIDINETPTALDLCGIFLQANKLYKIPSKLWRCLLRKRLTSARVGGLYAIAGYWFQAIKFLGQVVQSDAVEAKPELFAATINAMHSSDNALQSFGYLAQGLKAAYPFCDIHVYHRIDEDLQHIYPLELNGNRRRILLSDKHSIEIKALNGPEYSIVNTTETIYLFFPLKSGPDMRPVGLVSLENFLHYRSPYRQREEIAQIADLLRQAARAIEVKNQINNLVTNTQKRADNLHSLNIILTNILHHRTHEEKTIFQLILAGITSGWGLAFNRAILFLPDENQQFLESYLAVGHLKHTEAERDWQSLPVSNLEELVNHVLAGKGQITPLHKALEKLKIPLSSTISNLLVETYYKQKSFLNVRHRLATVPLSSDPNLSFQPHLRLPEALAQKILPPEEFAIVPLNTGQQTLGILYVDNKFSRHPITTELFELLQTFVNQTTLVLENARALISEKRRTNRLTELLQVEEEVNDQITKSVGVLMSQIVDSARHLIGADAAILNPLRPKVKPNQYIYDLEAIVFSGTYHQVKPINETRSPQGITAWVIREGILSIPDVRLAPPVPNGRRIAESPFIIRENIKAFVGIRLGSIDEPLGILYVYWRRPHLLTEEELTIIDIYAKFASVAIPSAHRHHQVQDELARRVQELESLSRVLSAGLETKPEQSGREVEETIKETLQAVEDHTTVHNVCLFRNEPYGKWRVYELTSSKMLTAQEISHIPWGLCHNAFIESEICLVNADAPSEIDTWFYPNSQSGLAMPVKVDEHALAILLLESSEPYGLTKGHFDFLKHLTGRLALTLEQAKIFDALRRLLDISSRHLADPEDLQGLLKYVVEQAMEALRTVDAITLYYIDRTTNKLVLGHTAGAKFEEAVREYSPNDGKLIREVMLLDKPIFSGENEDSLLIKGDYAIREGVQSAAAFPLKFREERVGCMFFNYRFPYNFSKSRRNLLGLFAHSAALAIYHTTLFNEANTSRQRLETVARITRVINASLELDEVFWNILREVKLAVPQAQNACIVEYNDDEEKLHVSAISLQFYQVDFPPLRGAYEVNTTQRQGIAGRVIRVGKPALVPDVSKDPDYISAISSTQSQICVPIRLEDKIEAAFVLESNQVNAFEADDRRLLEMLADYAAVAIQNARRYAALQTAQEKLVQTRDRELRERIATLATGLIHDINKAVANVPDLVTEIEEKLRSGGDITQPIANLRQNAEATNRISRGLHNFVIKRKFELHPVDLEPLMQNILKFADKQRPRHINFEIRYKSSADQIKIMADSTWLELLLENLITNAFEAIQTLDATHGLIEIEVLVKHNQVFIQVQDDGIGIPPEKINLIFKPGYTTKPYRGLHGIGLFHCQQIAQEHNGELKVTSELGHGSIFTVVLPIHNLGIQAKSI
ncbi:MAG: GAF domain-containing protein [Anaerolineae bacterium]|nr:GAF domain-containing protein [Anaerolineae bacterium]